jgi:hypothetical protein
MMTFFQYLKTTLKNNSGFAGLSLLKHRKIYSEWIDQMESKKSSMNLELPWITIFAKNYLINFLTDKSKSQVKIFEFGSGGSTVFFLKYSDEVVSIEHDKKWFELVSKTVDQKKVQGWDGHLIEAERVENYRKNELNGSNPYHYYSTDENFLNCTFKNYASYIDKFPDKYFDLILVDGRSRPSCLFHSVPKIKQGGLLILDNAERKYYLSNNIIDREEFALKISLNGALVSTNQFTQTNIYIKKDK